MQKLTMLEFTKFCNRNNPRFIFRSSDQIENSINREGIFCSTKLEFDHIIITYAPDTICLVNKGLGYLEFENVSDIYIRESDGDSNMLILICGNCRKFIIQMKT